MVESEDDFECFPLQSARPQSISRISNEIAVAVPGVDTKVPMEINEEEILERQNLLLQRDNLIRSLGVVELVHRLLQSTQVPSGYPVFKDKVVSFYHSTSQFFY